MPFAIRKERPHSDLNRLTSASGPFGTLSYSYDQVGNRLSAVVNGTGTTYSYGSYNKLMSAGTTSYSYDNNGNTITKTVGSNSWGYTYDYENRLKQVNLNGQTVLQALYDGDGRRIRTVAGDTTVYDYSGGSWDPAYVKDLTTGIVTDLVFAGGLRVGKVQAGVNNYYHLDRLGSVRLVTQSANVQTFTAKYLPYGNTYATTGSENFQYTGKQIDSSTGLSYYGYRYYDDQSGRFITLDLHQPNYLNPQSLNRYIYALDNPNAYIDPNGMMSTVGSWNEQGGGIPIVLVAFSLLELLSWEINHIDWDWSAGPYEEFSTPGTPGPTPSEEQAWQAAYQYSVQTSLWDLGWKKLKQMAHQELEKYYHENSPIARLQDIRIAMDAEIQCEIATQGMGMGGPLHGGHLLMIGYSTGILGTKIGTPIETPIEFDIRNPASFADFSGLLSMGLKVSSLGQANFNFWADEEVAINRYMQEGYTRAQAFQLLGEGD